MQHIRAADDERDLYVSKGFHFEKLKGRDPERSMRLNKQFRLILEIEDGNDSKRAIIKKIADYH
jgi:proteic killer suppression protein